MIVISSGKRFSNGLICWVVGQALDVPMNPRYLYRLVHKIGAFLYTGSLLRFVTRLSHSVLFKSFLIAHRTYRFENVIFTSSSRIARVSLFWHTRLMPHAWSAAKKLCLPFQVFDPRTVTTPLLENAALVNDSVLLKNTQMGSRLTFVRN